MLSVSVDMSDSDTDSSESEEAMFFSKTSVAIAGVLSPNSCSTRVI